jgi:hypothetical protein
VKGNTVSHDEKEGKQDVTRRTTPKDRESRQETELEAFMTLLRQAKNTPVVEAGKEETDRGGKGREKVLEIFRTLLRQAKAKNAVQNFR